MMLILKHKDEELLRFEVLKNIEEPVLKILWKNNKKKLKKSKGTNYLAPLRIE